MMELLPLIGWTLLGVVPSVGAVFGYLEYQAHLLRTEVKSVPGGLRFSAREFTVETRRSGNTVQVNCNNGQLSCQPLSGGAKQDSAGVLDLSFPAP